MKVLEADWTWRAGRLESDLQVEILDDGNIGRVGRGLSKTPERLAGEALLPGFVNVHSHAFQIGLRGRGETFGSFWSWREEMYRVAGSLDSAGFLELTTRAFREMLASGITTVGEFHYLHHIQGGRGYELDSVVVEAARVAGIRLVLLETCYLTGDIGKPLEGAQLRFASRSVDEFLRASEGLESSLDRSRESMGLVAHSVRAVPIEAIAEIHGAARERGLVFHMHVEEQRKEIEASLARYRRRPLQLLVERLPIGSETTAVHCTHSADEDLERFLAAGANVAVTPLTEANLADGIPPAILTRPGVALSLGTDSNLRVDFTEEMRLLEYAQRLRSEKRGRFTDASGSVAARLFEIATLGGARSLGVPVGEIEPGRAADFFTLRVSGIPAQELMTAFVLGAGREAIERIAVAGKWIPRVKGLDPDSDS